MLTLNNQKDKLNSRTTGISDGFICFRMIF